MIANILGSNIFHEVVGEGLPLVFMHGLGGTGNYWNAQRVCLQKFFKVITLDLPGSGRSDKSERSFSMERWSDQIAGLADHLKIDKFVLIGHSFTTVLAQVFAGRHENRLTGLVLCGPITELTPQAKETFTARAETVQREGMIAVADLVLTNALSPGTREGNPALAGLYREVLLANDPACYAAQAMALVHGSAKPYQAGIKCPTLIMVGDQDGVTPLANARVIAAAVSGARIKIIPGTAHLTMLERPELFNAALVEWLGSL